MASSLSLVGVIWTILSLFATLIACLGFFMPYWLTGDTLPSNGNDAALLSGRATSFGTFRRCGYGHVTSDEAGGGVRVVVRCGRYSSFDDIPTVWWRVTTVLVGAGCSLGVVVCSAALLCCCITDAMSRRLGVVACLVQLFAGLFFLFKTFVAHSNT